MHPKLLENTHFLRYYQRWQDDPSSVVFVSVADFFLEYNHVDEAISICKAGLRHHPNMVSGLLVLGRAYLKKGLKTLASEAAMHVLHLIPNHQEAKAILDADVIGEIAVQPPPPSAAPAVKKKKVLSLRTVTMAGILTQQGHYAQAARIYQEILAENPDHAEAQAGLERLAGLRQQNAESKELT